MYSVDALDVLDLCRCVLSMRLLYLTSVDALRRCVCCIWPPSMCFVDAFVVLDLCRCTLSMLSISSIMSVSDTLKMSSLPLDVRVGFPKAT